LSKKGAQMKKRILSCAILFAAFLVMLANNGCTKKSLGNQKKKVSYTIGWDIGSNIKRQQADVDINTLIKGLKDAMAGAKPLLTEEEMREAMMKFQTEMQEKQAKLHSEAAEKNKKEGAAFLEENKKKKDVKTTKSGLQYKVITQGKGKKPGLEDTVTVNYSGTLIDGTEFDSSYKRGEPATFPVQGVIPGMTEALQMMREGSKYELYIPSDLAYGERGAGGLIGPNAALIFTVELISINKEKK
jgi:FKBP-type peptidyl-prolyl cis-trans isomerase FklB